MKYDNTRVIDILNEDRTKIKAKCSICGKTTKWFIKDSYLGNKEDRPLCRECKVRLGLINKKK